MSAIITPQTDRLVGHVLIIEDDGITRLLETISLQHAGWVVSEAATGCDGVALAAETLPEVIICDRLLPDLDGIEVIAHLARDPATATIPVVLVTGMSEVDEIVAGIDAGAHDYLVKPFEMIELEVRCRAALRVSRQHRLLARSEHELRFMTENTTDLVVRCGQDGVIRYASPSVRTLLGWNPTELVGREATELCHPDDVIPIASFVPAQPGEVISVTRRALRRDGSYIWVESRAQTIVGPDGDLEVLSTSRDITDRMAAAAAMAESEAAYRRIVDLAAEGVCLVDPDQIITFANARMGEILGVPASGLLGRSTAEFMDDEGRAIAVARMKRRRAGIAESGDFKFVRADGSPVWTSFSAAPIIDDTGVFQGSIAMVFDVTERHRQEEALARSEARYRALVDHIPDTVAVVYDRAMRVVIAAGADLPARGFEADAMVGKRFDELVAPEDAAYLEGVYRAAFRGERTSVEFRSHLNGAENLLDVVPIAVPGDGEPTEILAVARNIGSLKERERALTAAEGRWRTAFERAPVGMADVSVDGRFERVNPALCAMVGYSAHQLLSMTPVALSHPEDAERARLAIASLALKQAQQYRGEKRYVHARGHIVWCAVSAVAVEDPDGRVDHLLVHYLDISELKRVETELQDLAVRDPLTGLLNRRGFDRALGQHLALVRRYGPVGALLVLDLDGLKAVNDRHGHEAGDQVIAQVADVLRRRLRSSDTVARLGGDEFAVLLPQVARHQAEGIAAELVGTIRHQTEIGHPGRDVTASIGVALFDPPGQTAQEVLSAADRAMYAAKTAGRDRYAICAAP